MANKIELVRFLDFDRFLIGRNFVVTTLGCILAFVLSYMTITYIPIPFVPYLLSLTYAIIITVSVYCRNIASSLLVGIFGSIGIVSPYGNGVDWINMYILITIVFSVILGLFADRLRLVMRWVRSNIFFSILFGVVILILGIYAEGYESQYWASNIQIGTSSALGSNYRLLLDAIYIGSIVIIGLIALIMVRGQMVLDTGSAKNYKIFGFIIFIIGNAISFVALIFYSHNIKLSVMKNLTNNKSQLITIDQIFTHLSSNQMYGVVVNPLDIYFVIALTILLTIIGISFYDLGDHKGNLEGMRGGMSIVFLAAPIAFVLYMIIGNYQVQHYLSTNGFYISEDAYSVFATIIWSFLFLSQFIAGILIFILRKLFK